ncbi:MAG: sugar phosphate isomerase/epimerase family protein [Christensenellales bacterium]|jgi:sugar phosphate isomerase/epimerase
MKKAFSTIGCPNWDMDSVLSTAKDFGYDGIEIRGIEGETFAPAIKVFGKEKIEETVAKINRLGLEISCLTSTVCVAHHGLRDEALSHGKAYIDLAQKLGCKYVRVMPTGVAYKDGGDIGLAKDLYLMLALYGEAKGVTPIMETNGMFVDTQALRRFMDSVASDNIGVLWDINHPYRYNSESIADTVANIGKYIKYVHFKDSSIKNGRVKYELIGRGDLPLSDCVNELKKIGYDGYLSLEWVKLWEKDLEEPVIIIPMYADYIKKLI